MSDFSIKISGVNSGKNSWSSVYKAGTTKLKNKTASKMSSKVVAKGIGSNVVDGFTQDIYFGSSNAINNLIPKTPNNVSIGYKNPMFVVSYTLY